jgi:hypothetical protein
MSAWSDQHHFEHTAHTSAITLNADVRLRSISDEMGQTPILDADVVLPQAAHHIATDSATHHDRGGGGVALDE